MKVAQLVKVWINLSYRYFSPYSPHRTNCNALDLLLGANTEDCFFLICPGHAIRQKPGFNSCHCNDGSSEGLVWQSFHAPADPKRHTAVDTFGKRAVVVTAASVPEREASKQVLSCGLPDGTKGFTAVFDRGWSRWQRPWVSQMGNGLLGMGDSGGFTTATDPRLCFTQKKIGGWTNFWLA